MNLSGNLRTTALHDVLRRLAVQRSTGVLHFERRPIEKRVVLHEGRIYSSWSNDPREGLGKFLVRDGGISEDQLFEAQLRQQTEGRLIGAILLADGVLTEERVQAVLVTKVEETIYDLFFWPEGRFHFHEGEFPKDVHIHVDMEVGEVLLEGARRIHEWVLIRRFFPDPLRTTFRVAAEPAEDDPAERRALSLAAAGKTLAQISVEMHWTEFETAVRFLDLHAREIVTLGPPRPEAADGITLTDVPALLARGYAKLQDGDHEEALRLYERILGLDRLNLHAKKGRLAVMEARSRLRSSPADPDPRGGLTPGQVTLVVTGGPQDGKVYALKEAPSQTILGSGSDCHLRIEMANVDRFHARIAAYARGLILSDAGSANGTFANGRLVEASHTLTDGDWIGLGPPESPDSASVLVRFPPRPKAFASSGPDRSRVISRS